MPDMLFDTHAFITMFERQPGWEIVRDYMRAVDDDDCSEFIPTVVLTEIMYLYTLQEEHTIAEQRIVQIMNSRMKTLPMDESISLVAGGIKKPGIALADAWIGATAPVHGLSVLSGDNTLTR